MTELIHEIQHKTYDTPELFPRRALLEGLKPQQLDDLISECFTKKQELDSIIELAIDVKENGYGAAA